mmetsp:Transcript_18151/g.56926  ORF Transcript_18151/g.56926 Transcript_18151/m.56926 type:complete len:298 (+) Transcript_18151:588-1481(+)
MFAAGLEVPGVHVPHGQECWTHLRALPLPLGQEEVPVHPCRHQGGRCLAQPGRLAHRRPACEAPPAEQAARSRAAARRREGRQGAPETAAARHLHRAQRRQHLQVLGQRELGLLPGLHAADGLAGRGRRLAHRNLQRQGGGAVPHEGPAAPARQGRRPNALDAQRDDGDGPVRARPQPELLLELQQGWRAQHLHPLHRGPGDRCAHTPALPPPHGAEALLRADHQRGEAEGVHRGLGQDQGAHHLAVQTRGLGRPGAQAAAWPCSAALAARRRRCPRRRPRLAGEAARAPSGGARIL